MYLVVSLLSWLLLLWVTMSQLQDSSRRGWGYQGSLVPLRHCPEGVWYWSQWHLLSWCCSLPRVISLWCPDTAYMHVYTLSFPCQFCFSCLCCPWFARLHSCRDQWQPMLFVFAVGDLWYLPMLVLFHSLFYSRISGQNAATGIVINNNH